jgi:hypothetical protein
VVSSEKLCDWLFQHQPDRILPLLAAAGAQHRALAGGGALPFPPAALRRSSSSGGVVVIAAIQVSRFNGQSIQELCAMGGISLEDFTQSVAYRKMLGRGRCKVRPEQKLREKPRSACAS